jgi:hypothetical protein
VAWAGARDLLAELLPIRERVLGAEHPETLIQGMSHGEIAKRLGIAAATVSVHAHRGVRSVHEELGQELDRKHPLIEQLLSHGAASGGAAPIAGCIGW